jgi:DNA-binding transcriptional ArsR family regulator
MTAGALADQFGVSKPTMSAHFAVLQEAELIEADRQGRTIIYRLQISVLEDTLLAFAETVGMRPRLVRAPRRPAVTTPPIRSVRGAQ